MHPLSANIFILLWGIENRTNNIADLYFESWFSVFDTAEQSMRIAWELSQPPWSHCFLFYWIGSQPPILWPLLEIVQLYVCEKSRLIVCTAISCWTCVLNVFNPQFCFPLRRWRWNCSQGRPIYTMDLHCSIILSKKTPEPQHIDGSYIFPYKVYISPRLYSRSTATWWHYNPSYIHSLDWDGTRWRYSWCVEFFLVMHHLPANISKSSSGEVENRTNNKADLYFEPCFCVYGTAKQNETNSHNDHDLTLFPAVDLVEPPLAGFSLNLLWMFYRHSLSLKDEDVVKGNLYSESSLPDYPEWKDNIGSQHYDGSNVFPHKIQTSLQQPETLTLVMQAMNGIRCLLFWLFIYPIGKYLPTEAFKEVLGHNNGRHMQQKRLPFQEEWEGKGGLGDDLLTRTLIDNAEEPGNLYLFLDSTSPTKSNWRAISWKVSDWGLIVMWPSMWPSVH